MTSCGRYCAVLKTSALHCASSWAVSWCCATSITYLCHWQTCRCLRASAALQTYTSSYHSWLSNTALAEHFIRGAGYVFSFPAAIPSPHSLRIQHLNHCQPSTCRAPAVSSHHDLFLPVPNRWLYSWLSIAPPQAVLVSSSTAPPAWWWAGREEDCHSK